MKRELTPREIIYNNSFIVDETTIEKKSTFENNKVYQTIEEALDIDKDGFHIYLVDSFSNKKLKEIVENIDALMKEKEKPKDICYYTFDNYREPKALIIKNSYGMKLKNQLEKIINLYTEKIFAFYNSEISEEKEQIINNVSKLRNDYIEEIIDAAKDEGFELKVTTVGITFVPITNESDEDEDEAETEIEDDTDDMSERVTKLRDDAEEILEKLKDMEEDSLDQLKEILRAYLVEESEHIKEDIIEEFERKDDAGIIKAKEYLLDICEDIENKFVEIYSMEYEADEEKFAEVLAQYVVNVLVDNSKVNRPKVLFEEDPSISNLFGVIEYENINGAYSTNVSLIKPGSLLEANEGCIILRLSSLLLHPNGYYYLRRALLNNRVSLDYDRGAYLELLSLNGLKPEPIPINLKVIIIGDYSSYDILYNNDEDFAKIFGVRAEVKEVVDIEESTKIEFFKHIKNLIDSEEIFELTDKAINELGKYLARKSGSRNRILWDIDEVEKILILANNTAKRKKRKFIKADDIIDVAYKASALELEYQKLYEDNKILINVKDEIIGSINALSVIDAGYLSFGKPIRVTCVVYKGTGRIIDTQRESNMSGSIHSKSINILKGFLNNYLDGYKATPVDFHLSFEQLYGGLDGDSASVAEVIAMISSLSKIPIKQSIAVTGSLNQFGEVQAIGGVNEKIEGFFKTCDVMDTHVGKGVIIPDSNKNELILSKEVEEAVESGEFHIYTMKNINDAIDALMISDGNTLEDIAAAISSEIEKYK
ncbi:MAG: AAA family ATPase [Sarcina sp.]